ncbi:MAG: hypothetical protein AAFP18_17825 [Bacteroidota bacterium]
MSLHGDLLDQAFLLARKEPRRPKQASLRRAVSTAYYAMFHLLTEESARLMVSGNARASLRLCVRRAHDHADMKSVARQFAEGGLSRKIEPGLNGQAIPVSLRGVAKAFVDLQEARHEADYDVSRTFTRAEVVTLLEQVAQALEDWRAVRGSLPADAFLVALLTLRSMKG